MVCNLDIRQFGRPPLVPFFLDVNVPLPLEMLVFVVVGEEGADAVGAPLQHPRGGVLLGGHVRVFRLLGGVRADHVGCLVDRDTGP